MRFTGHALSVFYAAGFLHVLYACMVWFIIPESLSLRRMKLLRHKYMEVVDGERVRGIVRRLFALLSPLRLLMPEIRSQEQGGSGPWKWKGRDWNLTLVAAAYGCTITLIVGVCLFSLWWTSAMMLFLPPSRELIRIRSNTLLRHLGGLRKRCVCHFIGVRSLWERGLSQLGYLLSLVGAVRAVFLTLILPRTFHHILHTPITIDHILQLR